ncbi:hypothetical protein SSP35_35_00050 [Streptomyces sp. NBRC 110611]|nr:hypothetical protein SSP35_35_00050 [Streptomyces sp. NBRC 110611]
MQGYTLSRVRANGSPDDGPVPPEGATGGQEHVDEAEDLHWHGKITVEFRSEAVPGGTVSHGRVPAKNPTAFPMTRPSTTPNGSGPIPASAARADASDQARSSRRRLHHCAADFRTTGCSVQGLPVPAF